MKPYETFSASANQCGVIEEENVEIFTKKRVSQMHNRRSLAYIIAREIDRPIKRIFQRKIMPQYTRYLKGDSFEKEARTAELWRKAGISVPRVLFFDESSIQLEYLANTISVRRELRENPSATAFESFTEIYAYIRSLAFTYQNTDYFHSDPHLGNFLLRGDGLILPIDSGLHIVGGTLDQVNSTLIAKTVYSIASSTHANRTEEYLELFANSLTNKELELSKYELTKPSEFALKAFHLRNRLAAKMLKQEFRPTELDNYSKYFPAIAQAFNL